MLNLLYKFKFKNGLIKTGELIQLQFVNKITNFYNLS